jgi:predicted RNA binding protein YcfA (HicA-like mRNA interferase family)
LTGRQPVVSGAQLVAALGKLGWVPVRQRGSHVRLRHADHANSLVVPLHRELKRGTLAGILRDAGVEGDELRRVL